MHTFFRGPALLLIAALVVACDGVNLTSASDPLLDAEGTDTALVSSEPTINAALLEPGAVSGDFFQLSDRWTSKELSYQIDTNSLIHNDIPIETIASHWSVEHVFGDWVRIKNRLTNQYLNIEPRDGQVHISNVPIGAHSGHWRFVNVGQYYSIENRWITNDRIHVETRDGLVRHGPVGNNLWSAQWTLQNTSHIAQIRSSVGGEWSPVVKWPLIAIHSALTADGRVMTYGTDENGAQGGQFVYDIWNPSLGTDTLSHSVLPNTTGTDLFCSAQVLLPGTDDLLITGGDSRGDGRAPNRGVTDTNLFNSSSDVLLRGTPMNYPRWYPTVHTLPNGEIFIHGGVDNFGQPVRTPEIYNAVTGVWRVLDDATSDIYRGGWWYPRAWVAPNGKLFGLTNGTIFEVDVTGNGSLRELGTETGTNNKLTATSVMFRPGRILQIGGGLRGAISANQDASAQVTEYNINTEEYAVIERPDLQYPRHWANSTMLPDGRVAVTGGSAAANTLKGVATAVELYDPDTNSWTTGASAVEDRLYHSTAILLPDATVLVTGGGAPGPRDNAGNVQPGNLNAEIYYPPYYFDENDNKRELASLISAPESINVQEQFSITVENAADVRQINLIRVGSVTHSVDMEQRFIPLDFNTAGSGGLRVTAPHNTMIAPPGYYLLFAVDKNGVPTKGSLISFDAGPGTDGPWFQLTDRWRSGELYVDNQMGEVSYGQRNTDQPDSHWVKEILGTGPWFRLRNRVTSQYLNTQSNNGIVGADVIGPNTWSSQWQEIKVGDYVLLENRWRANHKLHVEGNIGAQHGTVSNSFYSAQWLMSPVE